MKKLRYTPELHARRLAAYEEGEYTFIPPPCFTGWWDTEDWLNYVQFKDKELTGFIPKCGMFLCENIGEEYEKGDTSI